MLVNIKKFFNHRELLESLVIKEVKVRYKQSVLGAAWAILQPLSLMVIFTIIFSHFARIPSEGIPYPIFSYCALLPWTFFASSLSSAIPSIVGNMNLVTKIYFPREIFPVAAVIARFVDFLIASVIFIGMMIFYRVPLTINLFWIPLIVVVQIMLTFGIVLFASAVNVFYRDISQVIPLVMRIWMYLTPIIYPISLVPEKFRDIYMLNPMAGIIDSYRQIILVGDAPNFKYLAIGVVVSVILFFGSYVYFKSVEMRFADVI